MCVFSVMGHIKQSKEKDKGKSTIEGKITWNYNLTHRNHVKKSFNLLIWVILHPAFPSK